MKKHTYEKTFVERSKRSERSGLLSSNVFCKKMVYEKNIRKKHTCILNDLGRMNLFTLGISLISTIIFGIIDGILFMIAEEELQTEFIKISFFDKNMAELAAGGVSSSVAIFITFFVYDKLHHYYHLVDHPLIDAFGVLLGTIMVLGLYFVYKKYAESIYQEVKSFVDHEMIQKIHEQKPKAKIDTTEKQPKQ